MPFCFPARVGGSLVEYPDKLSALILEKEVDGLDAGAEYVFSVSAENSAGQGVPSNTLTATTFQTGRTVKRKGYGFCPLAASSCSW